MIDTIDRPGTASTAPDGRLTFLVPAGWRSLSPLAAAAIGAG